MKIRLGVLGAEDTVGIIRSIVDEHAGFQCLPIVYWKEEEIVDLLKSHAQDVDIWLFSGHVPYSIAKEWGGVTQPMFKVPWTGSSLYQTLWQISYEKKIRMNELSFDGIPPSELEQVFDEAGIKDKPLFVKHYPGKIHEDELVAYHYELWKKGKTKGAVTCMLHAQIPLQQLGVPVYRVLPARAAVESIIHMILRTWEMLRFKDAQIAVLMMEIDTLAGLSENMLSTDEFYNLEIKTTEKLLQYAKRVQGSLKPAGPGRFVIFTTRGQLRDITRNFSTVPYIEEIDPLGKEAITCGIGIGRSAYEAEIHAGKAMLHAKKHGKGTWIVFFDDKKIAGPLGKPEGISYSYISEELQEVSRQTSLSVSTLSKVESILKKIGRTEINAYELAQHMGIIARSARRILTQLERNGFAQVIGEESPHPRGRPRKMYRIFL
ncbi:transcriptional regulator [Marinithermofilum abyssi]|uniref:Transcriptional regulator n=1 Tax=Marinithermofilum abyssi TaxID=1571185 RepID=A0A8J2VCX8_9BACL|nr:ArsR family transcriptional regulator [Marinithermofilum abyssi]GGE18419.1 transcriptional regulator [Marinithermofilum abyssi]